MTKQDVLIRLCTLATNVGSEVFNERFSHDCLCEENNLSYPSSFSFDEVVMNFIEIAVREKIEAHK